MPRSKRKPVMTEQERAFDDSVRRAARQYRGLGGAQPGRLFQNVARYGAVEAARRAMVKMGTTGGYRDLVRRGRLDLTLEWLILDPRWPFFDAVTRGLAYERLNQALVPRRLGRAK